MYEIDIGDTIFTSMGWGKVVDYDALYIYVKLADKGICQFRKSYGELEIA